MVKIAWSGLTGHTGREAIKAVREMENLQIVAGISRVDRTMDPEFTSGDFAGVTWHRYGNLLHDNLDAWDGVDVLVDFSMPGCFDEILDLALKLKIPLVSGTAKLSQRQMNRFNGLAAASIPIYRGGNFLFGMQRFTDEVISRAQHSDHLPVLEEKFFFGKALPSEASQNLRKKVNLFTGKMLEVHSKLEYPRESRICDWQFGDLHYRTEGFAELARDVLRITEVMARKQPFGAPYNLEAIYRDLQVEA